MAVKLHLSSGEEYVVQGSTTEEIMELMNQHGLEGGYLNFSNGDVKDTIIIRHIVKISER